MVLLALRMMFLPMSCKCVKSHGSEEVFVQSVEAAPEPMCILATKQQLVDIERFCNGEASNVLSIDPTLNLGPFYVTPTTYHNLLVTTAHQNHPILLGPVLIHKGKPSGLSTTLVQL